MKQELINNAKVYFETFACGHTNIRNINDIEKYLNCNNRTVRQVINLLRTEYNMPIISLSADNIKGYFLYNSDKDNPYAEHFIAETLHRINEIRKIIYPIKQMIKDEQQLNLF